MADFKEGDTVYYYTSPGDIRCTTIDTIDSKGIAWLSGGNDWHHATYLYATLEEAKAGPSPDGKRMKWCFQEALKVLDETYPEADINGSHVLQIALKLFDIGND